MILSFVFLLSKIGVEQEILVFWINIRIVALHGSRLGGVGVAEVVAVGAVAAAVLVGRDVELAHLGAAHAGGAGVGARRRPLFCPCRRDSPRLLRTSLKAKVSPEAS